MPRPNTSTSEGSTHLNLGKQYRSAQPRQRPVIRRTSLYPAPHRIHHGTIIRDGLFEARLGIDIGAVLAAVVGGGVTWLRDAVWRHSLLVDGRYRHYVLLKGGLLMYESRINSWTTDLQS
jgi:hypothetical protein